MRDIWSDNQAIGNIFLKSMSLIFRSDVNQITDTGIKIRYQFYTNRTSTLLLGWERAKTFILDKWPYISSNVNHKLISIERINCTIDHAVDSFEFGFYSYDLQRRVWIANLYFLFDEVRNKILEIDLA